MDLALKSERVRSFTATPLPDDLELTILMPCLNEAETIVRCIAKAQGFLRRSQVRGEVLISDNGSSDNSQALASGAGARVISAAEPGYGAALIAGVRQARGRYIIMGDADDSYDFEALDAFLAQLRAGQDLVMGDRFAGERVPGAMPLLHRYLGNPVLSFLGRLFFRTPVRDFHCGLRGFSRQSILDLKLCMPGMEFASEMVVKAAMNGLKVAEAPVTLSPDGRSRPPHLRTWRDGWRHLRFLLLHSPEWLFIYPGAVLILAVATSVLFSTTGLIAVPQRLEAPALAGAGLAILTGWQLVLSGRLARAEGERAGTLTPRRRRTVATLVSLEALLTIAGALLLAGMAGIVYAASGAAGAGLAIPVLAGSLTAAAAAIHLAGSGFLASALRLRR